MLAPVLIAVSFVIAACGQSPQNLGSSFTVTSGQPVSPPPEIAGETGPQADLLSDIVARTSPSHLTRITFTDPPPDRGSGFGTPGTRWLVFEYVADHADAEYVESLWKSGIIASALRRAETAQGQPLVAGYTAELRSTTGKLSTTDLMTINASLNEYEPLRDARALEDRLRNVQSQNMEVIALEVLYPDGAAPVITLETRDANAFFGEASHELAKLVGPLGQYEGSLVRVLNADGALIWVQGTSARAGQTVTWSREGHQGES